MVDLRNFKEHQNQILNPSDTKLFDLEQLYSQPEVSFEEPEEDDDDDYISYVATEEPEMIRGTEGLLEAGEAPMFFGHTIFGREGDYRFETPKKSGNPEEDKDDDFNVPEAEENKESDDDDDKDSLESLYTPTPAEIREMKQLEAGQSEAGGTGTPSPRKAKSAQPPTPKRGQGVFRKEVIDHAIAREKTRAPEMDESPDPLKKYYLKYDPETDKLLVGHHEVVVNETTEILECSQCQIMGKGQGDIRQQWRDMEKNMVAHCIGRHLGGFPCQWCDVKSGSYSSLKLHWKRDHEGKKSKGSGGQGGVVGEKPYKCNMCEHCFSTPVGLQGHFMRRHSKAIEGAEKVKEIKPPKIKVKKSEGGASGVAKKGTPRRSGGGDVAEIKFGFPTKSPERPHECRVCKFAFTKGSHLKRHLAIHRKKGQLK